jgi:two-component system phosphate regulon sensor histidine kinase PhoR
VFASRFFRRLFLPYLLLVCAATASMGIFAAVRIRAGYVDRMHERLAAEATLATRQFEDDFAARQFDRLIFRVKELGAGLGCRVVATDGNGTVLADSEGAAAAVESLRSEQEIVQAQEQGEGFDVRRDPVLDVERVYVARRTATPDGRTYFVRLSAPLSALGRELGLLYGTLIAVALTATGLAAIICYVFASRHTAPVRELAAFAEALTRGEMSRRLPIGGAGEIGALTSSLNVMADSLGGLVSDLARERGELLAIVVSMNEGVIATDARQRIVLVNDKAAELLDFPRDSAQGKPLWEVVRNEPILRAAGEVLAGGERRIFQISPMVGRYLEIAACVYPAIGKMQGLVIVAHDTTKSVRYQELRKEFVANVSHELRTPLTVIRGFTETLRDGAISDPVAAPKFLATIGKHVDQLQNLVDDLLELSKLESSPEMPRRVSVDLGAVTRRVADLLSPAALKKKQTVSLDIPGYIPRILGSSDYLERAVSNLIDNAIKYSPESGAIQVGITYTNEWLTVQVQDNGIGIPQADLDRIFERFYRVDRSRSREMGGTGLGLSIVKHVAQVHGGTVDVISTPGQGSRFRLKLPIPED